jgi:hypothetical protein
MGDSYKRRKSGNPTSDIGKKYAEDHQRILERTEGAHEYFRPNCERFHQFLKFVYQNTMNDADESALTALQRPDIQFNIVNAPVDRLCGEFSKQEPSIYTSALDDTKIDPATIEVVEGIIRHMLYEAGQLGTQYNVHRDALAGGFSNLEVYTEYENERSFDQVIRFRRAYEPTLVLYDPMAREATKCDAKYSLKIYPMTEDDFKAKYPDANLSDIKFQRTSSSFTWSFTTADKQKIVMIVEYEEEKVKAEKIFKLSDGSVVNEEELEDKLLEYKDRIEQPPIVISERDTETHYRCRYIVNEAEVLKYEETDFKYPPNIFVDGNSVIIRENGTGQFKQFTKPYVYHAEGIQRMVNFAGQTIVNEYENTVMSKFFVAEEAMPSQDEYLDAYTEYQVPSNIVYKSMQILDSGEVIQLPMPQAIQRQPLPDGVMETFNTSMQMLQNILGAYDASLGIQNQQLSGVAIVEGATQSNAAAMPFVVNHMLALNQVARVTLDLIPKYYVTPRTIPIIDKEGQRQVIKINQPGHPSLDYDPNVLQVKVEAGVNFAIAKNRALQQIIAMMQAFPPFANFMMQDGLEVILDNMEFRGVDIVKEAARKYQEEMKQQQAQQQQTPPPEQIVAQSKMMDSQTKQQQVQLDAQKAQADQQQQQVANQLKSEEIQATKEANNIDLVKVLNDAKASDRQLQAAEAKAVAEINRTNADARIAKGDMALRVADQEHSHLKDILTMNHEFSQAQQQDSNQE